MFSKGGPQIPGSSQDPFRRSMRFKTIFIKVLRCICLFYCVDICTDGAKAKVGEKEKAKVGKRQWHQTVLVVTVFFHHCTLKNVLDEAVKIIKSPLLSTWLSNILPWLFGLGCLAGIFSKWTK